VSSILLSPSRHRCRIIGHRCRHPSLPLSPCRRAAVVMPFHLAALSPQCRHRTIAIFVAMSLPHHCNHCCHVVPTLLHPCLSPSQWSCCFVAVPLLCHRIIVAAVSIASLLSHRHNCCTIAAVARRSHRAIASSPCRCIVAAPLHHRRTIAIATSSPLCAVVDAMLHSLWVHWCDSTA